MASLPLDLSLTDTINTEPQEGVTKKNSPQGVSLPRIRCEIEELNPAILIVDVPDCWSSTSLRCGQNNHDDDGQEHEE